MHEREDKVNWPSKIRGEEGGMAVSGTAILAKGEKAVCETAI